MDAKFHQAEIVEHIKRCKWEIPRLIISLCTGLKAPWHLTDRVQMKQLWGAKPVLEIAFKSRLWYVITGCSFSRISPTRWKYFFFLQSGRGCARGEKPVLRSVAAKPWSWLGSGSRGGGIKAAKLVSRNHPESINQEKICKRVVDKTMAEMGGQAVTQEGGVDARWVGSSASLTRRPTRAGGMGGLGGWSEEEKVWNAF